MYSSDTDFTPFDKGAYASSTTYISGAATVKAAEKVAERIRARAANMFAENGLEVDPGEMLLGGPQSHRAERRRLHPGGDCPERPASS